MNATQFEINEKHRAAPIGLAALDDFDLHEQGEIPAQTILESPNITLYTLDFERERAVFVATPPDIDLSQAPFYYLAQYNHATHVYTLPFTTMIQLAQAVSIDDARLTLIHSVGRAGSTLASQLFAQVDGVINISEPDALTVLVQARYSQPDNEAALLALLDTTIRMLCKQPASTAWVIKGRSFVIELGDWLHRLFPHTKNIFLYRCAASWSQSSLRAFVNNVARTEEEQRAMEVNVRAFMTPMAPVLARSNPDEHLSTLGILACLWLSVMERYLQLHAAGVKMLAIRYASWQSAPRQTAVAMLTYCGCIPADITILDATLARDSQAGTFLSQDVVQQRQVELSAAERDELDRHLQAHPLIRTADFDVANTLGL